MQLPLQLLTFEYQQAQRVRSIWIDGEPWFLAKDVCEILGIKNIPDAVARLDADERRTIVLNDGTGGNPNKNVVSESGLYTIILRSDKPEAKSFRRWVTKEVLPSIRKTGTFGSRDLPAFIRRFNDNWDRIEPGYFSVISELFIRVYGRFEQLGHRLADRGPDGKEIRPDVSVGKTFAAWMREYHANEKAPFKPYKHLIGGIEVDARQYINAIWPLYADFIDNVWLSKYAPAYLAERDPRRFRIASTTPARSRSEATVNGARWKQISPSQGDDQETARSTGITLKPAKLYHYLLSRYFKISRTFAFALRLELCSSPNTPRGVHSRSDRHDQDKKKNGL